MLILQGALDKMPTHITPHSATDSNHVLDHTVNAYDVSYTFEVFNQKRTSSESCTLNDYLGYQMTLTYADFMSCKNCTRMMKKSYFQGLCGRCYFNSPAGAPCILKPEQCTAHISPQDSRCDAQQHTRPHCVYLVHAAKIKVGVTNCATLPTRWIDQGAHRAVVLAYTPNRAIAGEIEVALKAHYSDRQSWQKMLKGELQDHVNLMEEKNKAYDCLPAHLQSFCVMDEHAQADQWSKTITQLNYPFLKKLSKVKSLNLAKEGVIRGVLTAIKGQYLLFENEKVFNVRAYGGHHVRCVLEES